MASGVEQRAGIDRRTIGAEVRVVADRYQSLRAAIIDALERTMGRQLTEIDRAIYEAAEPRSIDRIGADRGEPPRVAFRFDGYTVRVRPEGNTAEVLVVP